MAVQIILLGAGFFLLVKGVDYFVEGAAGITACITPVPFLEAFIPDTLIAAVSGLLLLICVWKKKLTRAGGALLLTGYIIYFIYLV